MTQRYMQEVHGVVFSVPPFDHLNVRAMPSATSDVMTQIDDGAVITVLGEEMTDRTKWLMVTVGDKTGWVNAKYVKI